MTSAMNRTDSSMTGKQVLESSLQKLARLTSMMRSWGNLTAITAFGAMLASGSLFSAGESSGTKLMLSPAVMLAIVAITGVLLFEATRRKGDTLFDEISDELQWDIRQRTDSELRADNYEVRPELPVRIIIRDFVKATDMPLIPGKFGPLFYILICVGVLLSSMYVARFTQPSAGEQRLSGQMSDPAPM